jgi:type III secretory pathway lipoprotein EscJ
VNKIEPLLTTTNDKGEIEGVKYDRVGVVLVNAVQEQQQQIEKMESQNRSQQTQIETQRKQIESLMKALCKIDRTAEMCRP